MFIKGDIDYLHTTTTLQATPKKKTVLVDTRTVLIVTLL